MEATKVIKEIIKAVAELAFAERVGQARG